MADVPGDAAYKTRYFSLIFTARSFVAIIRALEIRMAADRDLPKLSSSCTTVVIAR